MRDSFEKVKTFLFIVTAPLWVGYWCLFMILILPFYLLYSVARQIAYACGYVHSYHYLYPRGPYRVGIAIHYREGHTPSGFLTPAERGHATHGKK